MEVVFLINFIGSGIYNFASTLRTQLGVFEEADAIELRIESTRSGRSMRDNIVQRKRPSCKSPVGITASLFSNHLKRVLTAMYMQCDCKQQQQEYEQLSKLQLYNVGYFFHLRSASCGINRQSSLNCFQSLNDFASTIRILEVD